MNECDGMFLIWHTALHNGFEPDTREIEEHVSECQECQERQQ